MSELSYSMQLVKEHSGWKLSQNSFMSLLVAVAEDSKGGGWVGGGGGDLD